MGIFEIALNVIKWGIGITFGLLILGAVELLIIISIREVFIFFSERVD